MNHLLKVRRRVLEGLRATRAVQGVLEGNPDRGAYARYLVNAWHYSRHSPKVMAIAAARCLDDRPELASYLLRHAAEEQGHHEWALADLRGLDVTEEEARRTAPVPACSAMIGYVHYVAGYANPVGLFGWMYVLEAVGEDLGKAAAEKLRAGLPVEGGALRFVAGHAVADVGHTHEITEKIEDHVRTDEDLEAVNGVADVVSELYVRMFREIGEEPAP